VTSQELQTMELEVKSAEQKATRLRFRFNAAVLMKRKADANKVRKRVVQTKKSKSAHGILRGDQESHRLMASMIHAGATAVVTQLFNSSATTSWSKTETVALAVYCTDPAFKRALTQPCTGPALSLLTPSYQPDHSRSSFCVLAFTKLLDVLNGMCCFEFKKQWKTFSDFVAARALELKKSSLEAKM
jgi:hypothetical protein